MIDADYFPSMPRREINKHDLTPEQFDKYTELAGKEAVRRLTPIVTRKAWANRSADSKADFIQKTYNEAREKARDRMKVLYPELRKKVKDK
jgi:hypothetical protein